MGFYTDEVTGAYKNTWDKAKSTIDGPINSFYNTFKSIIDENDFPSKAEERWSGMNEKIKSLSTELKTNIENKYGEMIKRAEEFDGWYTELKELEGDSGGDAGLNFAISKGFGRWVGTYSPRGLVGINYRQSKLYRWTAYRSVSIDSSTGYIKIEMCRREMKKSTNELDQTWIEYEKIVCSETKLVKSASDFAAYGKGGIGGDALTSDGNGDGNTSFK